MKKKLGVIILAAFIVIGVGANYDKMGNITHNTNVAYNSYSKTSIHIANELPVW